LFSSSSIPFSYGGLQVSDYSTSTGICSYIPKINVTAPDNYSFWGSDYYANITKSNLQSHNLAGIDWNVYAWSNTELTSQRIYRKTYDGDYTWTLTGGTFNAGKKTGSGGECIISEEDLDGTNPGKWQKITTFAITDPNTFVVYGRMYYDGYEGECAPKIKLRNPNGAWADYGDTSCPSSSAPNQTCYRYFSCGIDSLCPTFLPERLFSCYH